MAGDSADLAVAEWIVAEIAAKVSFATHQCDVAVIAGLTVRNCGDHDLEAVTLSLTASPAIVSPRTWIIDRLAVGAELRLTDRRISLDGGLLYALSERMRAEFVLELKTIDTTLASKAVPVVALARNEWGGTDVAPELLAAFVMPNNPAVQAILKETSEILEQAGQRSSIEGYQSKSRQRTWEIVSYQPPELMTRVPKIAWL